MKTHPNERGFILLVVYIVVICISIFAAAFYTRHSQATRTSWLYVAYPVRSAGQTNGVIRIGVPLTEPVM